MQAHLSKNRSETVATAYGLLRRLRLTFQRQAQLDPQRAERRDQLVDVGVGVQRGRA